ncbi:hypothetical protein [Shewanella gelidii]|uniref:Lipoprotein n=1 Tax=Shewanella gelidii TaxID=1642821 RepID=A0A917NE58_9GAMM|nr:hypothetical protein [Shewanella gelidii]MCL1099318.1 hypothetical protein [Shewanella gelidii]GGI91960.1 lipoprotein [Shewanella gelidii]
MKHKLLTAMMLGSIALTGCGTDDPEIIEEPVVVDPPQPPVVVDPPQPPVVVTPPVEVTTIEADEALAINLTLTSYDSASGTLLFDLKDDDGLAITNAKDYDIAFMGFPDPNEKSSKPKAWKRWHVAHVYHCQSSDEAECQGNLSETATKGSYAFNATDLDLMTDDPAKAVKSYLVGISIKGAQATNVVELNKPTI